MEKMKKQKSKFRKEIKKTATAGIVTAFGLIIALTWKDVLSEYFEQLVEISPLKGKIIGAIIITILSTLGIYLTTKLISE
jgi:hypothetical protein